MENLLYYGRKKRLRP
ncbi:hypothetical protein MTR67_018686 [Solanum verrucosum]|uniref:Uncharacterized protein n=1 Tax=Solanum verrucosum TaxID=315347 RepID=A0AAF0QR83_SOLVR|nr:hypothetical protein MTR67_018686 [Solanum verrucosum]